MSKILFENVIKDKEVKEKKVISIRVDKETSDKFDKLCDKHGLKKAGLYSWALEMAVEKLVEKFEDDDASK